MKMIVKGIFPSVIYPCLYIWQNNELHRTDYHSEYDLATSIKDFELEFVVLVCITLMTYSTLLSLNLRKGREKFSKFK